MPSEPAPLVVSGHAYGHRCTLELAGDTLTWRALRGIPPVRENIATTVHDIRSTQAPTLRWSFAGLALGAIGGIWTTADATIGGVGVAIAIGVVAWRLAHPRQLLVLELAGDRRLVLTVDPKSAAAAKQLAARIERASRDEATSPPALP